MSIEEIIKTELITENQSQINPEEIEFDDFSEVDYDLDYTVQY